MNEVAQANYAGDGEVKVDDVPLWDGYLPFTQRYANDDRERFKQATLGANGLDSFTPTRRWRIDAPLSLCGPGAPVAGPRNFVQRAGGTTLIGYDEWRALDTASMWTYRMRSFPPRCRRSERVLGASAQAAADNSSGSNDDAVDAHVNPRATAMASSDDWHYSGLPSFYELTPDLLSYAPGNSDPARRKPTLNFAVRVSRPAGQTRTSEARSQIPPSQRLNNYRAEPASDVYASVSASQAYFERPGARSDGRTELASLFNPYWQVHLIEASPYLPQALLLQGVSTP
jgi:hypothetical protein